MLPLGVNEQTVQVFVCDGRFHLEAVMIANPDVPAFKYDPYSKKLTSEGSPTATIRNSASLAVWCSYDHKEMLDIRHAATTVASTASLDPSKCNFGIVLGTLG